MRVRFRMLTHRHKVSTPGIKSLQHSDPIAQQRVLTATNSLARYYKPRVQLFSSTAHRRCNFGHSHHHLSIFRRPRTQRTLLKQPKLNKHRYGTSETCHPGPRHFRDPVLCTHCEVIYCTLILIHFCPRCAQDDGPSRYTSAPGTIRSKLGEISANPSASSSSPTVSHTCFFYSFASSKVPEALHTYHRPLDVISRLPEYLESLKSCSQQDDWEPSPGALCPTAHLETR